MAKPRRFERPLRIRFAHCDPAGSVFFPQYRVMFNGLAEDWATEELGIPYSELPGARRVGMPIVGLSCEFNAISRMGDDVMLGLSVERVGTKSLNLALDCRQQEQVCVRSRQMRVTTDLQTHRAIAIPPGLYEALVRFEHH